MELPGPVAFFDGECNVCDWSVRFLLRRDRAGTLRFASLQGETAAALQAERPDFPRDVDTFVLAEPTPDGLVLRTRTTGIVRALQLTGGRPILTAVLRAVPRPLRDLAYRVFVPLRLRIFGSKDECSIPSAADRARVLP